MGTRGLFGFKVNGETKLIYNHWDSYPSGLGEKLAAFIAFADLAKVKEAAAGLRDVTGSTPTPEQVEHCKRWTNLGVGRQSTQDWYCLLRGTQGNAAATLESGLYEDGSDMMGVEWTYIIDLDGGVFEVYDGGATPVVTLPLADVDPKTFADLVDAARGS